ncbi:MAG: hypothetical protein MI923_11385 [Phycisphaerales bacterium]|nr:hypothetical protein [Phycisphaerales bacterium]
MHSDAGTVRQAPEGKQQAPIGSLNWPPLLVGSVLLNRKRPDVLQPVSTRQHNVRNTTDASQRGMTGSLQSRGRSGPGIAHVAAQSRLESFRNGCFST